ncbi:cytochrome c family protein [bacterium]|nr:cytochrome c family protein [bacterium]MBU1882701.1 cytochrome c family protein [bacterium]
MKYLIAVLLLVSSLYSAKVVAIGEKYKTSDDCRACHNHIVKEWKNSWHSNSHYEKDEYFRASVDYVSRKTHKSLNSVKVECATCHNPRISVTSTDTDYEIAAVLGLDKNSKVNKAVHDDALDEGINCVVCHNIDTIHDDYNASLRGMDRVSWSKSGLMSGPFPDANSPYHKTEYREFMDKNPNQLCFVCHANDHTAEGQMFVNMQGEYKNSDEKCVTCHMGEKKDLYASTLRIDHGKPKARQIRDHGFSGAHIQSMWKDALKVSAKSEGNNLVITLKNDLPHNIPSGFGSREIIIDIEYKNFDGKVGSDSVSLTKQYLSKYKKPTIPHVAEKASADQSVPAKGEKIVRVKLNKKANNAVINVSYRLVNDEVRGILELKEPIWSEKMPIASVSVQF